MSAPDHRPYAAPTDLVTAADVLAWMQRPSVDRHAEHVASGGERLQPYIVDAQMLAYRLDRERRQACERGAEECERRLAELGPEPEEPTIDIWGTEALRARLRESALAFRAAARAK